jgi:hypothetical protein
MRRRARLVACLVASLSWTGSQADSGSPPPRRPATAAPVVAAAPGQVTPVTTLFVASSQAPPRELAAPWSLTASDGSGLVLTRVDAKAVVEGPLAFTELHLYFHNPEARTREGTFAITLPTGAAVSRFAMETNGQLVEAEVVEQQLARRAYEDFLHRRQDPALLEKAEGNQFSARVFPIAANADKHLVISFSQEVWPGTTRCRCAGWRPPRRSTCGSRSAARTARSPSRRCASATGSRIATWWSTARRWARRARSRPAS